MESSTLSKGGLKVFGHKNILETKLYEVAVNKELDFIKKLRKALFPMASKYHWEIGSEIFTWLQLGKMEVPFQDVMLKTKHGKINVKELVRVFKGRPINFRGNDFNPAQVGLNVQYRFLFDGTFEPFRLAHKHYEALHEFYAQGLQPNTAQAYKFPDFVKVMGLIPEDEPETKIKLLCDIGLISCSNAQGDLKSGNLYFGMKASESFSDWYSSSTSELVNILEQNRKEFWERVPIVSWFVKPDYSGEAYSEAFGGMVRTAGRVSKVQQVLVFVLFALLFSLAIYCGQSSNWTACSIFGAASVALLVSMINKIL